MNSNSNASNSSNKSTDKSSDKPTDKMDKLGNIVIVALEVIAIFLIIGLLIAEALGLTSRPC